MIPERNRVDEGFTSCFKQLVLADDVAMGCGPRTLWASFAHLSRDLQVAQDSATQPPQALDVPTPYFLKSLG